MHKLSNPELDTLMTQLAPQIQQAAASQLQRQALQQAGKNFLAAAGMGIAGRGLYGLFGQGRRNLGRSWEPQQAPLRLHPHREEKEKKASQTSPAPQSGIASYLRQLLSGQRAQTMQGVPWSAPLTMAAVGGGLIGGHQLTDWLMDSRRKADVNSELSAAKKEYEQALRSSGTAKIASEKTAAERVGEKLDELYELMAQQRTKAAFAPLTQGGFDDLLGQALGAYGVAALPVLAASGYLGHSFGKSRQKRKLLEEARDKRRRQLSGQGLPPLAVLSSK